MKKIIPSKIYLSLRYFKFYKKFPHIKNAKTFDEKILKYILYYRNDEMPTLVDKYLVRDYLSNKGYTQYLNKIHGIYDTFDDIDFTTLPTQFVLKTNHGCRFNIIVKDKSKIDMEATKKKVNKWMKTNHYDYAREWVYKDIKRKIIIEEYLENKGDEFLTNYNFYCFNGQAKHVNAVEYNSLTKKWFVTPYYCDWIPCEFKYKTHKKASHQQPLQLSKMVDLSNELSKGYPFMRVDLYVVNQKIYINELTFFPSAGLYPRIPASFDIIVGSLMSI